jgi:hypothetical protein
VDFVRHEGDAPAELCLAGLAAVVRVLDDELSSDALRELDETKIVGLSIAARLLADNLIHRLGDVAA